MNFVPRGPETDLSVPGPVDGAAAVQAPRVPTGNIRADEQERPNSSAGAEPRYFNRELSWLEFNRRVLALAESADQPLLERAKFLAIFSSNLDEFFQVRVAGLKDQLGGRPFRHRARRPLRFGPAESDPGCASGHAGPPVADLQRSAGPSTRGAAHLPRALGRSGAADMAFAESVFEAQMFPVLTPLGVDPGRPFPYISNLSLNLAVMVRDPERGTDVLPGSRSRNCCRGSSAYPTVSDLCPSNKSLLHSSANCSRGWK